MKALMSLLCVIANGVTYAGEIPLRFEAVPLLGDVQVGEPVGIRLSLTNATEKDVGFYGDLSIVGRFVTIVIKKPDGTTISISHPTSEENGEYRVVKAKENVVSMQLIHFDPSPIDHLNLALSQPGKYSVSVSLNLKNAEDGQYFSFGEREFDIRVVAGDECDGKKVFSDEHVLSALTYQNIDSIGIKKMEMLISSATDDPFLPYARYFVSQAYLLKGRHESRKEYARQCLELLAHSTFQFREFSANTLGAKLAKGIDLADPKTMQWPKLPDVLIKAVSPQPVLQRAQGSQADELERNAVNTLIQSFSTGLASGKVEAVLVLLSDDFKCGDRNKSDYRKDLEEDAGKLPKIGPITVSIKSDSILKLNDVLTARVNSKISWSNDTQKNEELQFWRFKKVDGHWRILEIDRSVTGNTK